LTLSGQKSHSLKQNDKVILGLSQANKEIREIFRKNRDRRDKLGVKGEQKG
jgi:hypothetical protein